MADLELPQIGDQEQEETPQKYLGEYDTREDAEKAFAEMREKLKAQEEQARKLQERVDMALARPEPVQKDDGPLLKPIDLPDPVEDPKGYKEAMKRFQETVAADIRSQHERLEATRIEQERKTRAEKLWNDFKSRYADLDDEVLAGAIAAREMQAIREAGGDPERYMKVNPEGFMDRVATGMRAHIARYQNKQESRTGGIPGGTTAPSGTRDEPHVPSFIEQMKKIRAESEKIFG